MDLPYVGFKRKLEVCFLFRDVCPTLGCGVRKGPGQCQELEAPPLISRATLPALHSPELGQGPPYIFRTVQSSYCLFNAVEADERAMESGSLASAAASPSPRNEPQLGLAGHAKPELLHSPCTPRALRHHTPTSPHFPQAPVHPQCNKMLVP